MQRFDYLRSGSVPVDKGRLPEHHVSSLHPLAAMQHEVKGAQVFRIQVRHTSVAMRHSDVSMNERLLELQCHVPKISQLPLEDEFET